MDDSASTTDLGDLIQKLSSLPADDHYGEVWVAQLGVIVGDEPDRSRLLRVLHDRSVDNEARYAALYGLQIDMRRRHDFTKLREVIREFGDEFAEHPHYDALMSHYHVLSSDPAERRKAVEHAEALRETRKSDPGYAHHLAYILAKYCRVARSDATAEARQALNLAKLAIARGPSPTPARYYMTLAQAEHANGHLEDAYKHAHLAIDLEDSSSPYYQLRLIEYQADLMEINARLRASELESVTSKTARQTEGLRGELLQMVGLLAAVVALLTLTGTQSRSLEFEDARRLIMVSAGSVLVIFTGFASLFSPVRPFGVLMAFLVGTTLLIVSYA